MRRPLVIALVLMGGGAASAALWLPNRNRECEQARAANLPDAEAICTRAAASGRGSSGSHGWTSTSSSSSGSGAASKASVGAVTRGGFGGAGASFSAGGS